MEVILVSVTEDDIGMDVFRRLEIGTINQIAIANAKRVASAKCEKRKEMRGSRVNVS